MHKKYSERKNLYKIGHICHIRSIKFEEFKSKQKYIISGYESELEKYEINKLIDPINNINIISKYNIKCG